MPQGILPYKYEEEKTLAGMTSLAGLPLYLDLAVALGLPKSIEHHLAFRPSQGWTDSQWFCPLCFSPWPVVTASMISRSSMLTRGSAGYSNT